MRGARKKSLRGLARKVRMMSGYKSFMRRKLCACGVAPAHRDKRVGGRSRQLHVESRPSGSRPCQTNPWLGELTPV